MRGIVLFLLVTLVSSYAWSINHQEEIAKAQEWADSFNKPYPIIIVDRDKTNFLIKANKASEDEDKRFEVIKDYFQREAGVSLTPQNFANVDTYISLLNNSAIALPITEGLGGEYKFCTVFANAPNGNSQVESNRIIGFNQPEAFSEHPDFNYNNLNEKMTFEELYLFSLYHEVAHCLDDQFLIEMQENGGEPHGIHEAETYAEVLAYFALIPRLGKEVASRRALYRTIYSRIVGEYLTTVPAFGTPHVGSGGAIYNLGPYLYKAQELLHFQIIDLNNPLNEVAKDFVFDHALSSREFHAIVTLLTQGAEKANEQYSEWAFDSPHFFYSAYMELVQYEHHTENLLNHAITVRPTPDYDSLPELDADLLCEMIQNKNLEGYLTALNDYRSIINVGLYEPSEITEVYETLNGMSLSCEDR